MDFSVFFFRSHLGERRNCGHDDGYGNAQLCPVPREGEGMVARAGSDDPPLLLLLKRPTKRKISGGGGTGVDPARIEA